MTSKPDRVRIISACLCGYVIFTEKQITPVRCRKIAQKGRWNYCTRPSVYFTIHGRAGGNNWYYRQNQHTPDGCYTPLDVILKTMGGQLQDDLSKLIRVAHQCAMASDKNNKVLQAHKSHQIHVIPMLQLISQISELQHSFKGHETVHYMIDLRGLSYCFVEGVLLEYFLKTLAVWFTSHQGLKRSKHR